MAGRGLKGKLAARPQLKVHTLSFSASLPLSLDSLRTFAAALSSNLDKLVRVPVRVVVITPVVGALVVVAAAAVIAVIILVAVVVIIVVIADFDQQHTHRKKAKVISVHRLAKG